MIPATEAVHRAASRSLPLFPGSKLIAGLRRSLLNQLHVERNVHVIAHHHAAVIEFGVPLHAEVLPVDFRGRRGRDSLISPGILYRSSQPIHVEYYLFGRAPDGEVAGHTE